MDYGRFDDLTRTIVTEAGTRRAVFRLLAGSALGGLAARLGLTEVAAAKRRKHKTKPKQQRKSQPERQAHGQLQAEGKGKKKKRHKKPKPSPDCDELTPRLCGKCEELVCAAGDWVCRSNGEKECPDGSCVAANTCCPDKYQCDDGTCVDPFEECCPGQKPCPGGSCVAENACCPGQKRCEGYTECFAKDDCCPAVNPPPCGECEKLVCETGELVCQPKSNCCPAGQKQCGGECIPETECCLTMAPLCQDNEQAVCCHGEWVCRYHRDLPEICGPFLPERTYNPANCRCECPPHTNDSASSCCPWDYPTGSPDVGYCCRWEDCGGYQCSRCVCALGFSRDARGVCRRTT